MRSQDCILIHGEPETVSNRIFELAADLAAWPRLLPHYRYMRIREQSERYKVADFGASRDGWPVRWTARQELFPAERRITFCHTAGVTAGMWVEWTIRPAEGGVQVCIEHTLRYPVPLLGELFADIIVGRMFIHNIAGKTLSRFKALVEAEGVAGKGTVTALRNG